jgi:hypothetical protein
LPRVCRCVASSSGPSSRTSRRSRRRCTRWSRRRSPHPVSFVRWLPSLDRPAVLTLADLPELQASRSPFCRKVSSGHSADLLAALDDLVTGAGAR